MKTIYFIALLLISVSFGSCDFFGKQEKSNEENPISQTTPVAKEEIVDDCDYNFKFQINPDHLKITHTSNINKDMRSGTLEVFDGELDLGRHGLEILPKEIFNYDCIKSLVLDKNSFRQFPLEVFKIDNLQKIDVSKNTILRFPSLKEESNLKSLKLSENQIKSISGQDLLKFKNLEYLYLKGNTAISELPDEIFELKNLKALDIRKTKLAKSYAKVQQLTKKLPNTQVFHFSK